MNTNNNVLLVIGIIVLLVLIGSLLGSGGRRKPRRTFSQTIDLDELNMSDKPPAHFITPSDESDQPNSQVEYFPPPQRHNGKMPELLLVPIRFYGTVVVALSMIVMLTIRMLGR